jgi:hypothetical protein
LTGFGLGGSWSADALSVCVVGFFSLSTPRPPFLKSGFAATSFGTHADHLIKMKADEFSRYNSPNKRHASRAL